jgi:hypothetical protein
MRNRAHKEGYYEACVRAQCQKLFLCGKWKFQLLLVFSVGSQNKQLSSFLCIKVNTLSNKLDVHESVHRDMIMKATNEMQLHRIIYYS